MLLATGVCKKRQLVQCWSPKDVVRLMTKNNQQTVLFADTGITVTVNDTPAAAVNAVAVTIAVTVTDTACYCDSYYHCHMNTTADIV